MVVCAWCGDWGLIIVTTKVSVSLIQAYVNNNPAIQHNSQIQQASTTASNGARQSRHHIRNMLENNQKIIGKTKKNNTNQRKGNKITKKPTKITNKSKKTKPQRTCSPGRG